MAHYCPVAPPLFLEQMGIQGLLGRHHLTLAHDIVKPENSGIYSKVFRAGSYLFDLIILDNSVVELGSAVKVEMIVEAAQTIWPTCVVLPDVYLKGKETSKSCQEAIDPWHHALIKAFSTIGIRRPPFMYLPQGKSFKEFAESATTLVGDPRITWWGIPRNIVEHHGSRRRAILLCKALAPTRRIHLFGFSDNMIDDLLCSQMKEVYSIDSAVPLRLTEPFSLTMTVPPRGDWWENATWLPIVPKNLETVRSVFGGDGL